MYSIGTYSIYIYLILGQQGKQSFASPVQQRVQNLQPSQNRCSFTEKFALRSANIAGAMWPTIHGAFGYACFSGWKADEEKREQYWWAVNSYLTWIVLAFLPIEMANGRQQQGFFTAARENSCLDPVQHKCQANSYLTAGQAAVRWEREAFASKINKGQRKNNYL